MIKINVIMLSPKSERFMIGKLRKTLISKPDCCIGFGFDDNKTCAALHRGLKILLRFLGDSCSNTRDLSWEHSHPPSRNISAAQESRGDLFLSQRLLSSSHAHSSHLQIHVQFTAGLFKQNYSGGICNYNRGNNRPGSGSGCGKPRSNSFPWRELNCVCTSWIDVLTDGDAGWFLQSFAIIVFHCIWSIYCHFLRQNVNDFSLMVHTFTNTRSDLLAACLK